MKKSISVVITDLDDTLWDWVDLWYHPFKAMLDRLVLDSGVPRDTLIQDFKAVFTKHGTCEYAFALEELPCLLKMHTAQEIPQKYKDAIEAFRAERRDASRLYPDVRETLEQIKDKGTLIVGYTESLAFYTRYRLIKLGLDRILDFLYSPEDHKLPEGITLETIRHYSPEHYQLRRTVHRHTPKGKQKPSPDVLLSIIEEIGANPEEVIYIGDKLVKDVAMAQDVGVMDVHARYGEAHQREEYELLRQVTHWSDEAVRKEQETTSPQVGPSYILHKSLAELHQHFDFVPFIDRSPEKIAHVLDAWKKTIDVQQHFNDIEMKIRYYMIILMVAILGVVGIAIKEELLVLPNWLIITGSIVVVLLFWMMDELWYHKLLVGAVRHAVGIERRYAQYLPEIGLSGAIGRASPIKIGRLKIHSKWKLRIFYGVIILLLAIAAFYFSFICPSPKASLEPRSPNVTDVNINITGVNIDQTRAAQGVAKQARNH